LGQGACHRRQLLQTAGRLVLLLQRAWLMGWLHGMAGWLW
jgi:hypothetical protein